MSIAPWDRRWSPPPTSSGIGIFANHAVCPPICASLLWDFSVRWKKSTPGSGFKPSGSAALRQLTYC